MAADFSQHPAQPGDSAEPAAKRIICESTDCSARAVSWFDLRHVCLDHFVSHCYSRLQECEAESSGRHAMDTSALGTTARFLDECMQKVLVLLITSAELQNFERARLVDILLWATELNEKYSFIPKWRAALG